ncbi:MAG: PKD domain-containing protein [bacterium]
MARHLSLILVAVCALAQKPVQQMVFPEPKTAMHGKVTEVTIPGEGMLLEEEGRPKVPYARREIPFPRGFRVTDVKLVNVAAPESLKDIMLPVVQINAYLDNPPPMTPGYFPKEQFRWELLDNADGGTVLVLSVFPFHFDPKTRTGVFFRGYEFKTEGIETGVSISGIAVDRPDFEPGTTVRVGVGLDNTGAAQPLTVEAAVFDPNAERLVARLSTVKLTLAGADSVALTWNPGKETAGDFELRVTVKDASGIELDQDRAWLRVGRPNAKLSGFRAGPDPFRRGEPVTMEFRLDNTGNCILSGAAVFVVGRAGELVEELRETYSGVRPGQGRTFRQSWNTDSVETDIVYEIAGLARYEGGATLAERAEVSTNARPDAVFTVSAETVAVTQAVEFDATGSSDPDGAVAELRWEFGDGAIASGRTASHAFSEPGTYRTLLTVTDDRGRSASTERLVVVAGK